MTTNKPIKKIPYIRLSYFLIILSGLSEGFGIALFVPLLNFLAESENGKILSSPLFSGLETVGIDLSAHSLIWLLFGIIGFIGGGLLIAYAQNYLLSHITLNYARNLRQRYLKALFGASLEVIVTKSHGETINHITTESHRACHALRAQVQSVAFFILIVIYALFSAIISPVLLLGSVAFAAITLAVIWPLHRRAHGLGRAINAVNHVFSFRALDFLRAGRLVKASASEKPVTKRMDNITNDVYDAYLKSDELRIRTYYLQQALPVLMVAGLIGASHLYLDIAAPLILTFLLFLARIAPRVTQLQQQRQTYAVNGPAIGAIENAITELERHTETAPRNEAHNKLAFNDAIALEKAVYHYGDADQAAINSVSLKLPKNTMVALVGSSGSGKSTLADIIAGLRKPTGGRILVDGNNMWHGGVMDWRARTGYVSQDITVLNDTVRANLTFAAPDATDANIEEALKIARIDDVVAKLPEGLETVLGEGGVRLSGGQRQRLALARALVSKPELLILDEATSALDNESERLIQVAIEAIAHRITIVVIAHRLSTVRRADIICVMEEGRIIEHGTFDALISDGNRFAELHKLQLS